MSNVWLKFKIWTKALFFSAILLYALLFLWKNSGRTVSIWVWFGREAIPQLLVLVFVTFASGVVLTLLVKTLWRTIRQIKEATARGRQTQLEKDLADMKSKAAMLQTRPDPNKPIDPVL